MSLAAIDLDRDAAGELARAELAKPEYHRDDPGLVQRVGEWLQARLSDIVDTATGATPGGALGVVVLVLLALLVVAVILYRVGGIRGAATTPTPLLTGRARSAAEYRAGAESAAADSHFDLAIRERLRAVARELETRAVLDARPGRTADELARDGGAALPELAEPLRAATRVFDDVWYGGRTATAESYAVVVRADDLVRDARVAAR